MTSIFQKLCFGFSRNEFTAEAVRRLLLETHDQYDSGPYWRFAKEGQFMMLFLEISSNWIIEHSSPRAIIKDICGGNGTLGLSLALHGFKNYTLMDCNTTFLDWGTLLFKHFGMRLKKQEFDVITDNTSPHDADIVTLLGWENFDFSYLRAFIVARSQLKENGYFLFTFQDDAQTQASEWEEYFAGHHQGWDRKNKPKVGYYLADYEDITTWLHQAGFAPLWKKSAHTLIGSNGTVYPQYLVLARPIECALKGKTRYATSTLSKNADYLLSSAPEAPKNTASLTAYRDMLSTLQGIPNVSLMSMKEFAKIEPQPGEIAIGLRHDVDSNLPMAFRCAEIEASLGLSGTYFILFSAFDYYGCFEPSEGTFYRHEGIAEALSRIQALGAEIGWHNDSFSALLCWDLDPAAFLHNELEYLRNRGIAITGTVGHTSLNSYDGVANFEFFIGQTLNGRRWACSGNHLVPVGRYALKQFGLEYDASSILQARFSHRASTMGTYIAEEGTLELLHNDYTTRITLDGDSWYMSTIPLIYERLSVEGIISFIRNYPVSAKIIIDSHPEHFIYDIY